MTALPVGGIGSRTTSAQFSTAGIFQRQPAAESFGNYVFRGGTEPDPTIDARLPRLVMADNDDQYSPEETARRMERGMAPGAQHASATARRKS